MKTEKNASKRVIFLVAGVLGGLVLALAIFMGVRMARAGDVPSGLDYATTKASDKGLFNISYTASTGTVPVNQIHQWTLHVETRDGEIVEAATITVDGDMPQHGHGLPTRPQVTAYLGQGDYLVEGMKFQMGGWWVMDFTITADGQTDTVRFNMMLK